MRRIFTLTALLLAAATASPPAAADTILTGVGATFPFPLYQQWFRAYERLEGVAFDYDAAGSGAGIEALLDRSADFGATDAFLTDDQIAAIDGDVLHVPTCLGAVVVTYNVPGIPELRFTPELLADIFSGRITDWTDRRIAQVNPGLRFPDRAITVIHRSDPSGTTLIFSDFLSKTAPSWNYSIGAGTTVAWPVGLGADGNAEVAHLVSETVGSISYIAHTYARKEDLPTAAVRNREAYYIKPTVDSITAAARVPLPDDSRILLTNTEAPEGYPITGMSYVVLRREQAFGRRDAGRAKALATFLWWATHDGQILNEELSYAPLPKNAVMRAESALKSMTFNGRAVLD
jgi:phosphate transport system substrate-binding protein